VGRYHRIEPVVRVPRAVGVLIGRIIPGKKGLRAFAKEESVARAVGNRRDLGHAVVIDHAVVLRKLALPVTLLPGSRERSLVAAVAGELLIPGSGRKSIDVLYKAGIGGRGTDHRRLPWVARTVQNRDLDAGDRDIGRLVIREVEVGCVVDRLLFE